MVTYFFVPDSTLVFCHMDNAGNNWPFCFSTTARVTERLYQFAKSKNVSIAAAELANGTWDKICVIDGLSGFDPIHFLNPPPKNIWWNKNVYWDWAGLNSKLWDLVLISPSGEMLVVNARG